MHLDRPYLIFCMFDNTHTRREYNLIINIKNKRKRIEYKRITEYANVDK